MLHLCRVFRKNLRSQDGFVLIAAVMAVMILIAVGFFALTVSTQDMRVSTRLVGERKAFSAAESGLNEVCRTLNPNSATAIVAQKVDPTNDPKTEFDATAPIRDENIAEMWFPGFEPGNKSAVFRTEITGRDTSYGSEARLSVGIASTPAPTGTQQGPF